MADCDAVVIGGGHNGLVAALCLADAGWRVIVLEQADEVGGTVRSAEVTLPGFVHDLFASNIGRIAVSPTYQKFRAEFDQAGVRFLGSRLPFSSAYPDGSAARMYMDPERQEKEMAGHSAADLAGWRRTLALFKKTAPHFLPLHFSALPSREAARHVGRLVGSAPVEALALARILRQSTREFTDQRFHTPAAKGLFTPWGFHSDFGPDVAGGATFAFVAALTAHLRGLGLVQGGAGRVSQALRRLIEARRGQVLTGTAATRVIVRGGRAAAVETARGDTISAARAIVANVTPGALFGHLVAEEDVPGRYVRRMERFRYGPSTFIVHLALSAPLQWNAAELGDFTYVHVCATADEIGRAYRESLDGKIPARPMLIVSQTTQADPSRAPPGRHVARIHARSFPRHVQGDAAGRIAGRTWDDIKEAVADRLIDILQEHAPNARSVLLARHTVSPADLAGGNPSLVDGDCNGGSHHLDQSYFRRPRYRTPIEGLFMIGAGTWPGSGVHGSSGYLLAQQLLG